MKKRMNDRDLSAFLRFLFGSVFTFSLYTFSGENNKEAYLNRLYGFPTDFNVSRDRPEILEYLVDVERSFGAQHPE